MSTSWEPLPSIYRSKQEFLASLPPWRRLLQKLNWRPTIDKRVRQYAIEQRMLQDAKEDERLRKEDERLAVLDARLRAILHSSVTSSIPPSSMPGRFEP